MTGATEKSLRRAGMPYEKSYTHALHHASYYPGAERIAMKLLFAPESGRVLGAQAVGRAGVEKRIDVIAMAIQKGATVFDLEEAELCYAPQYGSAKDPVNMAGFVAANILRGDVAVGHWSEWKRRAGGRRHAGDARRSPADGRGRRRDSRHDPHSAGRTPCPARRIAPRPRNLGPLRRRPDLVQRRAIAAAARFQGPQPVGRNNVVQDGE